MFIYFKHNNLKNLISIVFNILFYINYIHWSNNLNNNTLYFINKIINTNINILSDNYNDYKKSIDILNNIYKNKKNKIVFNINSNKYKYNTQINNFKKKNKIIYNLPIFNKLIYTKYFNNQENKNSIVNEIIYLNQINKSNIYILFLLIDTLLYNNVSIKRNNIYSNNMINHQCYKNIMFSSGPVYPILNDINRIFDIDWNKEYIYHIYNSSYKNTNYNKYNYYLWNEDIYRDVNTISYIYNTNKILNSLINILNILILIFNNNKNNIGNSIYIKNITYKFKFTLVYLINSFYLNNNNYSTIIKNIKNINIINNNNNIINYKIINKIIEISKRYLINKYLYIVLIASKEEYVLNKEKQLILLLQKGYLSLLVSIDQFEPDLGYSFSTYCNFWVYQSIRNLYQISENDKGTNSKKENSRKIISSERPMYSNANNSISDYLKDFSNEKYSNNYLLNIYFKKLPNSIVTLLAMRYGIPPFSKHTLEEVGNLLSVNGETIRYIIRIALKKFEEPIK